MAKRSNACATKQRLAHRLRNSFLQPLFGLHANKALDDLSLFEEHDGTNGTDAETGRCVGAVVDVDLDDLDSVSVFSRQLLKQGG